LFNVFLQRLMLFQAINCAWYWITRDAFWRLRGKPCTNQNGGVNILSGKCCINTTLKPRACSGLNSLVVVSAITIGWL